jgi:hypothetical protein
MVDTEKLIDRAYLHKGGNRYARLGLKRRIKRINKPRAKV